MAICPKCGNQTGEGAVFCDQCGTRLSQPEVAAPEATPAPAAASVICPACGASNVPGEAFCDFCGSPLDAPVPTAEEVAEPGPATAPAEPELEEASPVEEAHAEPAPDAKPTCPACGAEVVPGEAFCANCGASLAESPIPPEPVAEAEPEPAAVVEPEAAAEPEAHVEPATEAAPPPVPTCPACGVEVESGDAFCSACGFALEGTPAPAPEAPPAPAPAPVPAAAPAGPRLVVVASGAEIPLPEKEEILVGREDPVSGVYPDVDLTPHDGEEGGVSRQHARLYMEGGNYLVEDLDSTNFTFVNKQKLTPKTGRPLNDGDELRVGRVALVFRTS